MRRSLFVVLAVALFFVSCGRSTDGKFGAELYEVSCTGCHVSDGTGGLLGPDIASPGSRSEAELTDAQLFGVIRVGPGAMPGNPRLSDEQVTSLVAYLRSLQRGD